MKKVFRQLSLLVCAMFLVGLAGCSEEMKAEPKKVVAVEAPKTLERMTLDVYKSPTCDCCGRWVSHIESKGFDANTHHLVDLNGIKSKFGIEPQYQSCHTGVSKDGYVFEGHIPAEIMQRFLAEKPENALGLAVPGMPMGSPGMEMSDRRDDYEVLLLKKGGGSSVYARIRS